MDIKVSVIIPVYNVEKYIGECLESIIGQTLKEIEIICVDDGSSDNSVAILEEYKQKDNRIIILKQNNLFAGVARNNGLKVAKGKYVYFADSDDYCDKKLLEECFVCAEERDAEIVVFDYFKVSEEDGSVTSFKGMNSRNVPDVNANFSYRDNPLTVCNTINPTPWNKFIKREFLNAHNIRYAELSTTNDITFATVCALKAEAIAYIPQGFYYYRVGNSGNITSKKRKNLDNIIKAVLQVYEEARKLPYFDMIKDSLRRFVAQNLFVGLDRYAGDSDSLKYVEYKHKVESILASHPLFVGFKATKAIDVATMARISEFRKQGVERRDFRFAREIIVSLTSYPKRIGTVHKVIASLLEQTLPANRIILWLSKEQFPNLDQDLPFYLMEYVGNGLEIKWREGDMKSHKKYLYAMQEYPDALHITADDDLVYDRNTIERLFLSYLEYPDAVSAMRVHLMKQENNEITPYAKWVKEYSGIMHIPSMKLFSTSGAGTLYPPNCMSKLLFSTELIQEHCFYADDLWLKIMQVMNNTPVVAVNLKQRLRYVEGTQEDTLYSTNITANDEQLRNCLNYLDTAEIISKEEFNKRIFEAKDGADVHQESFECKEDTLLRLVTIQKTGKDSFETSKELKQREFEKEKEVEKLKKINEDLNKRELEKEKEVEKLKKINEDLNKRELEKEREIEKLKKINEDLNKRELEKEREIEKLKRELSNVKNGWSFRLGRLFTFLPRKVLGKKW